MKKLALLFSLVMVTISTYAQYGEISGKVIDHNGEGIAKATVTLVNEAGESVGKSTTTDLDGNYAIKPLTPGKYNITIACEGHTSQIQKGVIISADKPTWLNANMKPDPNYIPRKGKAKGKRKK